MNIKSKIRKLKNKPMWLYTWNEIRRFIGKHNFRKYSDIEFIEKLYYKTTKRKINWKNPVRYTEKLQWLKLFYRDSDIPIVSDKYAVREYLTNHGFGYLLNELIGEYDSVEQIDFSELPNQFVIKAAHGSGWNLIVQDKTKIDWFWWKKIIKSWLNQDLYWYGREWNYHEQKHRIIVEKYLEDDSGELRDYKIFCFNGNPTYIQYDENRSKNHRRIYTDVQGNVLDMEDSQGSCTEFGVKFGNPQRKMVEIARILSQPFPNVRVDFYECKGNVIFGEMTFFGGSGFYSFSPDKWDTIWGDKVILPKPNYNLDLFNQLQKKN